MKTALTILEYINGTFYYDILRYALTAFQYKKPTVKLRIFNKLMKIISDHLYHELSLFYFIFSELF